MIAYHLDRYSSLSAGQILNLEPFHYEMGFQNMNFNTLAHNLSLIGFDSISHFGKIMTENVEMDTLPMLTNRYIEFIFEMVRTREFPDMPSRLKCLFSFPTLSCIKEWSEYLIQSSSPVWEVSCDSESVITLDARFLRAGDHLHNPDDSVTYDNARKYWNRETSPRPLLETLLPLPAKIVRQVSVY